MASRVQSQHRENVINITLTVVINMINKHFHNVVSTYDIHHNIYNEYNTISQLC